MATLLETIQNNLNQMQPVQAQDQTAQARKLLAATSGKAVTPGSMAPASNIQEQAANDQTKQQLGQVQQQGQMQATQLQQGQQQIQQQEQTQRTQLAQESAATIQRANNQRNQIMQELSQSHQTLDMERDRAKLEQIAQSTAFNNKQYIDNLQMAGEQMRLNSELAFKEAQARTIIGNNLDLLRAQLQTSAITELNQRELEKKLAAMDIETAVQIATNAAKEERLAAQIGAGQKLVQLGAEYAVGKMGTSGGTTTGSQSTELAQPNQSSNENNYQSMKSWDESH